MSKSFNHLFGRKYKCCSVVDFAAVLVEFQCCSSSSSSVVVVVVVEFCSVVVLLLLQSC